VSWAELWRAVPHTIKVLILAVHDILPSPSNLHIWGGRVTSRPHCARGQGPWSISSGHYCGVMMTKSARSSATAESTTASIFPAKKTIAFIRTGQRPTAQDWAQTVDLGMQIKFPGNAAFTTLSRDMVLLSEASTQVILLVPWEDCIDELNKR